MRKPDANSNASTKGSLMLPRDWNSSVPPKNEERLAGQLTAPLFAVLHFVKPGESKRLFYYPSTDPPDLILGPVHLRSIAELSPSSMAGGIHLHSGGTGVMDVLTAVTTAQGD